MCSHSTGDRALSTAPSPRWGLEKWGAAYLGSPRLQPSDPGYMPPPLSGLSPPGKLVPERSGGAKLQVFSRGAIVGRGGAACGPLRNEVRSRKLLEPRKILGRNVRPEAATGPRVLGAGQGRRIRQLNKGDN